MALFFMAILVVLSFAINYMLLNEVRSERNFLEGVKAYYSAEAGVEDALLQVSVNNAGAGIDPKVDVSFVEDAFILVPSAFEEEEAAQVSQSKYSYDVTSRGGANPCTFEENYAGFARLDAGESVRISLNGNQFFNVEYYIVNTEYPFDTPNNDPSYVMQNDALRWKILGDRSPGDSYSRVEAISDYVSIYDVNHNAPNQPSTFGTHAEFAEYQNGKYYDIIDGVISDTSDLIYTEDYDPLANNFAEGGFHYIFHPNYPIQSFIGSHANNQLVLTNYLNVIPPTAPDTDLIYDADDYELYYRVEPNPDVSSPARYTVSCSAVRVSADGFSANEDFKQSIDVLRPLDQAAPFTDFAWYERGME